jgi:hypothetical protein
MLYLAHLRHNIGGLDKALRSLPSGNNNMDAGGPFPQNAEDLLLADKAQTAQIGKLVLNNEPVSARGDDPRGLAPRGAGGFPVRLQILSGKNEPQAEAFKIKEPLAGGEEGLSRRRVAFYKLENAALPAPAQSAEDLTQSGRGFAFSVSGKNKEESHQLFLFPRVKYSNANSPRARRVSSVSIVSLPWGLLSNSKFENYRRILTTEDTENTEEERERRREEIEKRRKDGPLPFFFSHFSFLIRFSFLRVTPGPPWFLFLKELPEPTINQILTYGIVRDMAEFLEALMVICFGVSWPASLVKAWRVRTAKGKSILFLLFVEMGYICGISAKIVSGNITYVFVFYALNSVFVATDIALYFRNRALDKARQNGESAER